MLSYVFMKILESRPRSYDRRMSQLSRGRTAAMKAQVCAAIPQGAQVLEIGCGTGELAARLITERAATVRAFDASAAMVEQARKRADEPEIVGRLAVEHHGVDGMDGVDDGRYDAVVATLVLSELPDQERRYALRHARRALRPGGLLVVADEVVPRGTARRWLHAVGRAPLLAATYLATGMSTRPLASLSDELATAGFTVREESRSNGDGFSVLVATADANGAAWPSRSRQRDRDPS